MLGEIRHKKTNIIFYLHDISKVILTIQSNSQEQKVNDGG